MPLPTIREARWFYQVAKQRYEDAEFLLAAERTTGAVYLTGYGVECMLKALVLAHTPPRPRAKLLQSFRGKRAHDYDWLKARYFNQGGVPFPGTIINAFILMEIWNTDLRYLASKMASSDATEFMQAAQRIMTWIDGRM